jgi:hypothetical protein
VHRTAVDSTYQGSDEAANTVLLTERPVLRDLAPLLIDVVMADEFSVTEIYIYMSTSSWTQIGAMRLYRVSHYKRGVGRSSVGVLSAGSNMPSRHFLTSFPCFQLLSSIFLKQRLSQTPMI